MSNTQFTIILEQKIQKKQAKAKMQVEVCVQECSTAHVHVQEVFYGKRLAASFQGFTLAEALRPIHPNERRNKSRRNILTKEEEETLHKTRRALREMQLAG